LNHTILLKVDFDISLARKKAILNASYEEIDTENDQAYSDDGKTTPMCKF